MVQTRPHHLMVSMVNLIPAALVDLAVTVFPGIQEEPLTESLLGL